MKRLSPPYCYFGGKGREVGRIIPLLPKPGPKVLTYVEAYFGAGNVYWNMPRFRSECINDRDDRIVTTMRVLQDRKKGEELERRLVLTMHARSEFKRAVEVYNSGDTSDDILCAWAVITTLGQAHAGRQDKFAEGRWGRVVAFPVMGNRLSKIAKRIQWFNRLRHAHIENTDALKVIKFWDRPTTLFYLDPPYIEDTRPNSIGVYGRDETDDHHVRLVELLLSIKGMVALSGYRSPIYKPLEDAGWELTTWKTRSSIGNMIRAKEGTTKKEFSKRRERFECLWCNPLCVKMRLGGLLR